MLGNEVVETVVESWVVLRQQEEQALARMNEVIAQGGFWWPGYGIDDEHTRRLRAVEKVILKEEGYHGRKPSLSFFYARQDR